jgi:hypothetical protein
MKRIYLFSMFFAIVLINQAQTTSFTSIEELAKNKKIDIELKSLGGYQGECVQIDIENITNEALHIWLESGRRLDNLNDAQQDILVLKDQRFNLNAKKTTTIKAFGFCCQSSNRGPRADQKFSIGWMEKDNLLWIAQYLNEHPVDFATMQSAVWVFSNDKNPASILQSKEEGVLELKKAIAKRLNIEIPWYEIYYEKDTNMVFSDKHYNLKGPIQYSLPNRGWLSMVVRGPQKQVMHKFTNTAFVEGGVYNYDVNLSIKEWPKGAYKIEIYLDDILKKQINFSI